VEQVILVDAQDRQVGVEDKLAAHRGCQRHRAFSVFLFRSDGRMLLQRRHELKYHTGGLWTNACDGHPRPGEDTVAAGRRRLREELGIDTGLEEALVFSYEAPLGDDLMECEIDHVLIGRYDGDPQPDPQEVSAWAWVEPALLTHDVAEFPERYAIWMRIPLQRVLEEAGLDADGDAVRSEG
jgi:isopentenyl-diphosphate Delta-isomerase